MIRLVLVLAIFLGFWNNSKACDICGCGVGGYYSGILPQFHKHIVGLRWRYSSFRSFLDHKHNGVDSVSKENFHTLELWGRFYPHRRVQILAYLPLNYHYRKESDTTHHLIGLGDVSLFALYNVYNSAFLAETTVKHSLLLGGGVKVPTGNFQRKHNDGSLLSPNVQLGTGSVDFVAMLIYTMRYERWGLNFNGTYKLNLPNKNGYRFGDQLALSLTGFFLQKIGEVGIMPQLGVNVEYAMNNRENGYLRINTGGFLSTMSIGVDVYYKNWSLAVNFQQPAWQDLSDGQVYANPRVMAGVNYMF